jgi:Flp pilus assembly protein TadD
MPSTENVHAVIELDDLEIASRPEGGWDASAESGRQTIQRALTALFQPITVVAGVDIQPSRVIIRLKVRRSPDARKLLDKGIRLGEAGKLGASIETLTRAMRSDPASAQIHYNLAVAYIEKGDVEAAADPLARSIALSPGPSAEMLLALGNVARQRGESHRALGYYRRADAMEPDNPRIERNLAVALVETGDVIGAEEHFRRLLAREPNSPEVRLGFGMVLAQAGERDAAVAQFRDALALAEGRGGIAAQARVRLRELGIEEDARPAPSSRPAGRSVIGKQPKLLPVTQQLLDDSAEQTGIGFEFLERPDLVSRATVQIARGGMDRHRILYRSSESPMDHMVAHEVGHIVRLWTVPEDQRQLPFSTLDTKMGAIHQLGEELTKLANEEKLPPEYLAKSFELIYPGMVRQAANIPIDIRIERWLYERYPELRRVQRESLLSQLKEGVEATAERIRRTTPHTVFYGSSVMNCAFTIAVGELYGETELWEPYRGSPYWSEGMRLVRMIDAADDDAGGDVRLVDDWARALKVRDWYRWIKLVDAPAADAMVAA